MHKNLQLRRHGLKEGEHISPEGLAELQMPKSVIYPEAITDVFCGSYLGRTTESALAVVAFHEIKARVHPPDERFGNEKFFNALKKIGIAKIAKRYDNPLEALFRILGDEAIDLLKFELVMAVEATFKKIKSHGLMYGHSPIIELIAKIYGNTQKDLVLMPNQGIILLQVGKEIRFSMTI